jgi:hypothetical protein
MQIIEKFDVNSQGEGGEISSRQRVLEIKDAIRFEDEKLRNRFPILDHQVA